MVFVDGFNLYHALDDLCKNLTKTTAIKHNHLKWLDLHGLSSAFITKADSLAGVYYFSAYATWRQNGSYQRHQTYVQALQSKGVAVVLGKFKERPNQCKKCGAQWIKHEEKATDVNIAIHLVQAAYADKFDRAIVMTADTDIVPAIRMVKKLFPNKQVDVAIPVGHTGKTAELRMVCDNTITMKLSHFQRNRLPETFTTAKGTTVTVPDAYKIK
ncbi:hypothetical protein GCM10009007_18950 [Formosimonas limnophila]|uniref:NYN domain-containing protein n=2 Tax=Formosimonas limnophila TaxID=1384487 RepID=A0A8J3CLU0_9BURK|nr:hypothetical protein GCM10009007_18950 [Formosimonas limnophila]